MVGEHPVENDHNVIGPCRTGRVDIVSIRDTRALLLLTGFVNSLFSIINLLLLNVYFSCNVEKLDVVGEKSFN